jgi:uncharacterized protein
MAKVVAWLVLIFVVLLALRMINARKARSRTRDAASAAPAEIPAQPMVRCARCGVFLPRNDASPVAGGYTCADNECAKR